jgi:hypothetical protein
MTGQLEHWRWSFYSWRPSGLALGLALRFWQRLKPLWQQWKARRAAAAVKPAPVAAPVAKAVEPAKTIMESEHASPSHSQR